MECLYGKADWVRDYLKMFDVEKSICVASALFNYSVSMTLILKCTNTLRKHVRKYAYIEI